MNGKMLKTADTQLVENILTVCLFLMSIFSPRQYNYAYCLVSFTLCVIGVIIFIKYWKKHNNNFMDFSPIFITTALVMGYIFPLFIYSKDPSTAYYFSWGIPYSLEYINQGACLSGLGILSFISGSTSKAKQINKSSIKIIKTNNLVYLFWLILIFLFIILGGFQRYKNIYQNIYSQSNPILTYLEVFIVSLSQVILINEIWNKNNSKSYKLNKISLAIVTIVGLTFMYVGNRTFCLYLLLPAIVFFTTRYFNIKLKSFILIIVFGGSLMIASMLFRSGEGINENLDWYYYLVDLMNPNTTTYLSCEIVDKRGITCGESMLGSLLGIVPFGQSIVHIFFGLTPDDINSATIFTKYLGVTVAGTGTNFISDSYLAFGAVGVIIFSYIPGKLINYLKVNQNNSYKIFLFYMIICGFSIYAVRASFLFILRFIFYGWLFAYINSHIRYWLNPRKV